MNEWISVEERLPHRGVEVLAFGKRRIYTATLIGPDYYICELDVDNEWLHHIGNFYIEEVTHWMPLPEPPDSHAPSDCDPTGHNIESEPGQ